MGYGDLSCLNAASKIRTPHLDRLAAEGMIFTDAHSSSAVCTPSRHSILTGRYAWRSPLKEGVTYGYSGPLIESGRMTSHRCCAKQRWEISMETALVDERGQLTRNDITPFDQRILPAPKEGGFRQEGYWVWCGSVVQGDDGRYHMFAARWPKKYPFSHGYLAASEVVRASADEPTGLYRFEDFVLPAREASFWDGRITHNPFIVKYGDEFLLFYIGATYPGDTPSSEEMRALNQESGGNGRIPPWYSSIRIGIARSKSVFGPWQRRDAPTLDINPSGWDNGVVSNPSVCVAPDGRILLYYRSTGCKLGLAVTSSPDAPFVRQSDAPVLDPGEGLRVEDPFVFWNGDRYEMVCKDLTGKITGEFHSAVHLFSEDAMAWELAPRPKAWSRTIRWDDGTTTTQASIERPFILFENGQPAYLFAATADGPGPHDGRPGHYFAENTWNMAIPLKHCLVNRIGSREAGWTAMRAGA